jgi:hypothetical protein
VPETRHVGVTCMRESAHVRLLPVILARSATLAVVQRVRLDFCQLCTVEGAELVAHGQWLTSEHFNLFSDGAGADIVERCAGV